MTVECIQITRALDKLGDAISEQLRHIAAEQRKTNDMLWELKKLLLEDGDDSGTEFPA